MSTEADFRLWLDRRDAEALGRVVDRDRCGPGSPMLAPARHSFLVQAEGYHPATCAVDVVQEP